MTKLISKEDRFVMKDTRFVKNACFYKDMFAFYDAYSSILSQPKEKLPKFCFFNNGEFCLEGICLVICDYASEFDFESLRLTLDYLKVLYYTIASYSDDENLPDKHLIETEFEEYKKASKNLVESSRKEFDEIAKKFDEKKQDYDKISAKYAGKLVSANLLNIFSIFVLVFSFGAGIIPFAIYSFGKLSLWLSALVAGLSFGVGIAIYFLLKHLSKKQELNAGEISYLLQQKKHAKDDVLKEFDNKKLKYAKICSEKYEYCNIFSDAMAPFTKKIGIDEILQKASEYKLLSYNLRIDIQSIFVTQQNSVNEIVREIDTLPRTFEQSNRLVEIYKNIQASDWFFYNNEVRFAYLKKFTEIAEKSYNWKLNIDGEKINPFSINIKAMAKENISYLRSENSLFVSATLDKFLNTKYIKNSRVLELKNINSVESLKNVKLEFLTHFYDFEKTKVYDNLFYDKKFTGDAEVTSDIRENTQKIPTFVLMKLKFIECKLGLENSNYEIISQIASDISKLKFGEETVEVKEYSDEQPVSDIITEDFGDYIRYNVGGNVFIGYKFA